MRLTRYIIFLSVAALFTGCKSTKRLASPEDLASAKIISSHYGTHFNFETLTARLRIKYSDENTSQNLTVSLRMENNETIWMSASVMGITLAKAMITGDKVQYYEKIEGTFFNGDFRLLSDLLGTELNFKQVQALMLGQPLYDLQTGNYSAGAGDFNYLVVPKKQQRLFDLYFYLNPGQFTMQQQRIDQKQENRVLTISYSNYSRQAGGMMPGRISVRAVEDGKTTEIDIEYRSVELNTPISFPFSIPDGYKEIKL